MLSVLMQAAGTIVWPRSCSRRRGTSMPIPFTNAVRVAVMTLRSKLGDAAGGAHRPAGRLPVRRIGQRCALTPRRRATSLAVARAAGRLGHSLLRRLGWRLSCHLLARYYARRARDCTSGGGALEPGRPLQRVRGVGSHHRWPYALARAAGHDLGRRFVSPTASPAGSPGRSVRWRRPSTSSGRRTSGCGCGRRARRDETPALGEAVDAMLDRVAEGYEAQRRFAANASHELRTPLATQRALIEISLSVGPHRRPAGPAVAAAAGHQRAQREPDRGLLVLAETERGLMAALRCGWTSSPPTSWRRCDRAAGGAR